MTKNNIITIVRGDDSNFVNETLLIVNFSSEDMDLTGFKAFLTIENSRNYTKTYDLKDGSIEIILEKYVSSTLEVGEHRCNIKLIDTLGRIRTVKTFNIKVIDEFNIDNLQYNEHVIDIGFSSKDYNMLFNKPSINGIELTGNKSLEELGIQYAGNYSTVEYVDTLTENINSEIDSLELKVNKKSDIDYVDVELALKADKTDLNTKANISDIPTRVSQLVNDEGYLTEHQDISNKADIDYVEELLDRKSDKADTYTKVEINTLIDDVNDNIELKQDKLTAGENITIDENNVISAIGGVSGGVTSVNGKTGDVELTAKDVGALIQEDLTDYVKNTDYASASEGGVVKFNSIYGNGVLGSGVVTTVKSTDDEVVAKTQKYRPIVPANLDLAVKTGVTTNTIELSADEKASAKNWLGFATPTEIMQAIASIPQFKLSIVEALPETGEKMTLYLVSKGTESPDVYDEYIWIEETSTFEFLGTTAVDLTDYVKNTDYATSSKGGVVKTSSYYGNGIGSTGILIGAIRTLEQYNKSLDNAGFICKGTLENIKNNYIKEAVTTNTIELTDDEKVSARTWLGAVGDTDYAGQDKAGVIKASGGLGYYISVTGYLLGVIADLATYNSAQNAYMICKGTLDNVLTQYSKTVLTTEADYNALETKDANTLYLIE